MTDIIKTWPSCVPAKTVARIFTPENRWAMFYFTLGRGKPKNPINRLWFTYQGRILGNFHVAEVVQNDGSFPKLQRLDGGESDWQIKPDAWVAICTDFVKLKDRVFMSGFRGFRYFDLEEYRGTPDSRMRL